MIQRPLALLALIALPAAAFAGVPTQRKVGDLSFVPHVVETAGGEKVEAELGSLVVPENRKRPESGVLELFFVRLKSTSPNPGPPIVYLAGGPGGSGIETLRGPRYPLFAALREVGDVIALDQRGVGRSQPVLMLCRESWTYPVDRPVGRAELAEAARQHARSCASFLARNGIDAMGYTTEESAEDLEDLRRALGAPRLSLWGVSYGSNLALSALRRHPGSFHRVVLAGVEGPDQERRLPSDLDRLLAEIDRQVRDDAGLREAVPDLLGLLRSVLARLDRQPVTTEVLDQHAGRKVAVTVGAFDLRMMTAQALSSTEGIRRLPAQVHALSQGDFSALAQFVYRRRKGWLGPAMPYLVNCTAGTSPERAARILREEGGTILGNAVDFPFPEICEAWGVAAPGPGSWAPVMSETPALFIAGTLDGRTPPGNAAEVAKRFKNGVQLVVEGAGHGDDLLLSSPAIRQAMVDFLRGGTVRDARIGLGPFRFDPVPPVQRNSRSSM